ncbi:hypothetical protein BJY52DRAFT_1235402, partial [Lactarius psammicola]
MRLQTTYCIPLAGLAFCMALTSRNTEIRFRLERIWCTKSLREGVHRHVYCMSNFFMSAHRQAHRLRALSLT